MMWLWDYYRQFTKTNDAKPAQGFELQRFNQLLGLLFVSFSVYSISMGDAMDDSAHLDIIKDYFTIMTTAYSTFMAAAIAALALPSLSGNQRSLGASACFVLASSLSTLGVMLVLYLRITIRRTLSKRIRLKPYGSFPLAIPEFIAAFSAFLLLIGTLVMAFGESDNDSNASQKMSWYRLLVTVPSGVTFLLCFVVVLSSEVHAQKCRSVNQDFLYVLAYDVNPYGCAFEVGQ
ncbi:hypothetical protein FRC09_017820 [Ceratobasidium sp. 395]|nr:hypothetical protein FRC09_017820 [Ceratobasidium sp. 395]